jgi:hypothetical protein
MQVQFVWLANGGRNSYLLLETNKHVLKSCKLKPLHGHARFAA